MHRTSTALALSALALSLTACGMMPGASKSMTAMVEMKPTTAAAAANLSPAGTVTFTQAPGGKVMVDAKISGLKPNSEHGFHVHDVADCSGDGTKTGGHFNPDNHPHNHPKEAARHAGAMFNIKTDANGNGTLKQEVDTVTLAEGKYSIIGRPLIVHRDPDDYKSQPLGNAGPRVGCGIIAKS
ncbi:MAG: superoxide dismutase family protein [Burkholderiaceae bacterium]